MATATAPRPDMRSTIAVRATLTAPGTRRLRRATTTRDTGTAIRVTARDTGTATTTTRARTRVTVGATAGATATAAVAATTRARTANAATGRTTSIRRMPKLTRRAGTF